MIQIKYCGEKTAYPATFKKIGKNIAQVTGEFPVKSKGFTCHRLGMTDEILGDYSEYKTVYRRIDGGVQFSDNGSVYTAPAPLVTFTAGPGGSIEGVLSQAVGLYENLAVPVPVPDGNYQFSGWTPEIPTAGEIKDGAAFQANFIYVETLDEVKEAKVAEVNAAQQQLIAAGIDVTLSDGTTDHFDLTDRDQMRLMGLQKQVESGQEMISWHTSDENEHCKFYKNEDMQLIVSKAMGYVTWHVTYFRDLRIYIRSLGKKEEVASVYYGMEIPVEYQSEPLKAMLAAQTV